MSAIHARSQLRHGPRNDSDRKPAGPGSSGTKYNKHLASRVFDAIASAQAPWTPHGIVIGARIGGVEAASVDTSGGGTGTLRRASGEAKDSVIRPWYVDAMKRLAIVFLLMLTAGAVLAQDQEGGADEEFISDPIEVTMEIFVVNVVQGEEQLRPATTARPGQVVEYRVNALNRSPDTLPAGSVEIVGPILDGTTYVANSATPSSDQILTEYSADDGQSYSEEPVLVGAGDDREVAEPESYTHIRWTLLEPMEPGQEETFFYRVTID